MKNGTKILIAGISLIFFMLVLPRFAVEFLEGMATTGLWMLSFFVVYPLLVVVIGIMAGTDIRRLWWLPLLSAISFPLLFSVAICDMVWDLYVYSAIYLPMGSIAMLGTYFGIKFIKKGGT